MGLCAFAVEVCGGHTGVRVLRTKSQISYFVHAKKRLKVLYKDKKRNLAREWIMKIIILYKIVIYRDKLFLFKNEI